MFTITARPLQAAAMSIVLAFAAAPGSAQDFSGLRVSPGDAVYVTSPSSGTTIRGTVTRLSSTMLAVDGRDFPYEPGLQIARDGDRLWNGFIIGAGLGAALGVSIGAESCLNQPKWHCAAKGGVTIGALGALIDFTRRGRTVIFRAGR